jgi:outer membrane receptor protein involved in Fe transport
MKRVSGTKITLRWARLAALAAAAAAAAAWPQEDFVPEGETYVIDNPSAWSRLRGEYAASIGVEPFVVRGEIGILDYITVGVSYGGVYVFGTGTPTMNPRPGFQAKFRLTNGGPILPAVAVGYDDQGHGKYYDFNPRYPRQNVDYDRYQFKAKGFYLVLSQEIELLGALGLHLGVSYNVIEDKDDADPDVFGSLEKALGPHLVLLGTYSPGLNDNARDSLGSGRGYLDAGVRWRVTENFNLEFRFANLLENQLEALGAEGGYIRRLELAYVGTF